MCISEGFNGMILVDQTEHEGIYPGECMKRRQNNGHSANRRDCIEGSEEVRGSAQAGAVMEVFLLERAWM